MTKAKLIEELEEIPDDTPIAINVGLKAAEKLRDRLDKYLSSNVMPIKAA